jgi:hypothetical protein
VTGGNYGTVENCASHAIVTTSDATGTAGNCIAGGIAGLCARGGRIEYCVAMSERVIAGEFGLAAGSHTGAIVGHNLGRIGENFRRTDMTLTLDRTRPGRNQYELSSLQKKEWWTVNRHIRFAFGHDNARPWAWDDEAKRPALHTLGIDRMKLVSGRL